MTVWKKITTDREYRKALKRMDALMDHSRTDPEENEFTLLAYLIEEYETSHVDMGEVSPAEMLRFMMEMKKIRQTDLIPMLGSKSYVSRIVNGIAPIPLESIHILSTFLGIPPETLIPRPQANTENKIRRAMRNA